MNYCYLLCTIDFFLSLVDGLVWIKTWYSSKGRKRINLGWYLQLRINSRLG